MKSYSSSKDLFFLDEKNAELKKENLWFEEEEIKKDKMYYDTIVQLTQNFLQYCENKENFRVDLLVQEINQIMKNPIFATYYSNILELSEKLDLGEKYYIEIFCGLLCFRCKKESKMHQYFKDNLKEFIVDERINNTKYSSSLKEISFENINPAFVTNLKLLVTNIIDNDKEEKKIMDLIKELKKSENSNQISSVSTSISEENKCIFDENKNTQKPIASTLVQIDIKSATKR